MPDTITAQQLKRYISLTLKVRELSSPVIEEIKGAEDYRQTLLRNFARIGTFARENNKILADYWWPLIRKDTPLLPEESAALKGFSTALLDAYSMENLDLPMRYLQTTRLLRDADEKKDEADILRMLDAQIEAIFAMMHMTQRFHFCAPICYEYRDEGLSAALRLLSYLHHDRFQELAGDREKEIVLINARYMSALFDRSDAYGDADINKKDLDHLLMALHLSEDPFYIENAPSYDWTYHNFRTLQYISQLLYSGNVRGFTPEEVGVIHDHTVRLKELWQIEHDRLSAHSSDDLIDLHLLRTSYKAGRMDAVAYKERLLSLYEKCSPDDYSFFNSSLYLLVPMELFMLFRGKEIPPADSAGLEAYYAGLISYVHRMPKKGSLSFFLTYLSDILQNFVHVPGGIDFETFCLRLMVSLHPPTYVHTLSVSDFSVCMTGHLIHRKPELFVGVCGTKNTDDVLAHKEEIVDFAKHAALCHDFGKLFITEVIMTYGRNLFDEEFLLIRQHPLIGAFLLEHHEETARYANVARFHHQWYDGSAGYPVNTSCAHLPEKAIIDIVTCADCLDASTDDVGRSYKKGKTLDDYISEVFEGRGTRYAPYLAELLSNTEVRTDIEQILASGRDENYRRAYRILAS